MVVPSLLTSEDIQLPTLVVNESVRVGLRGKPSCIGSAGGAFPPARCADTVSGSTQTDKASVAIARRAREPVRWRVETMGDADMGSPYSMKTQSTDEAISERRSCTVTLQTVS